MAHIRVGTRSSILAMAQTEMVADLLRRLGHSVELVTMETRGDQVLDRSLHEIGQKGLFTEELEQALLSDAIDLAVHSLKDLPTELPPGLRLGAYTLPSDRRDVLLSGGLSFEEMARGARLGTSSLRRAAFLRSERPELIVVPIRGNLKTRREKWQAGACDALVLAAAGVIRMGWASLISEYLDPRVVIPSPGQGVLAVEVAEHRSDLAELMNAINDERTEILCVAERAVLDELGGGCQVPLGAYAEWQGKERLRLSAKVAGLDGRSVLVKSVDCSAGDAEQSGRVVGRHLREQGALELIQTQEG